MLKNPYSPYRPLQGSRGRKERESWTECAMLSPANVKETRREQIIIGCVTAQKKERKEKKRKKIRKKKRKRKEKAGLRWAFCVFLSTPRQELLDVRHSVFIVGNAGTGKTCVWKTLFKTYQVHIHHDSMGRCIKGVHRGGYRILDSS